MRKSLQGGTLLPTPLRGPDGSIVALAQGPLSIGGFGGGGGGNAVAVNHLTVGRVPGGGWCRWRARRRWRRPTELRLRAARAGLRLGRPRRQSDQHGAWRRLARTSATRARSSSSVPQRVSRDSVADLVARLEPLPIAMDTPARVRHQRAHGHGGPRRRRRIGAGGRGARQPLGPHRDATTRCRSPKDSRRGETDGDAADAGQRRSGRPPARLRSSEGTTLADVVRALNTLGVTPRDIIAIMQALKAAGALRAEVVIL